MKSLRACKSLNDIRVVVSRIDRDLVKLLGLRTRYAIEALRFKPDVKSIRRPGHLRNFYARRRKWALRYGVSERLVGKIYRSIFAESTRLHLAGFRARRRASARLPR